MSDNLGIHIEIMDGGVGDTPEEINKIRKEAQANTLKNQQQDESIKDINTSIENQNITIEELDKSTSDNLAQINKDIEIKEKELKEKDEELESEIIAQKEELEKLKIIELYKPDGYVNTGLVRHYDYGLQKKLVEIGLQDWESWYDLAGNKDAVLDNHISIQNSYLKQGINIDTSINAERISIDGLEEDKEFTFEVTAIIQNDDDVVSHWGYGYPFGSYFGIFSNQISFNNGHSTLVLKSIPYKLSTTTITYNRSKNEMKGYVDGILTTSKIASGVESFLDRIQIGHSYQNRYVNSIYNNIKIYNRVLSDNEVMKNAISTGVYDLTKETANIMELREMIAMRGLTR